MMGEVVRGADLLIKKQHRRSILYEGNEPLCMTNTWLKREEMRMRDLS